jgi:hypothetical protein
VDLEVLVLDFGVVALVLELHPSVILVAKTLRGVLVVALVVLIHRPYLRCVTGDDPLVVVGEVALLLACIL